MMIQGRGRTCLYLKLLETLLRRCQYHLTATNQAVVALRMLWENRDMFDLVISDVHMPDMDGFKLLGIDKAVPKRILELMNVEKLTRENVASHLQGAPIQYTPTLKGPVLLSLELKQCQCFTSLK